MRHRDGSPRRSSSLWASVDGAAPAGRLRPRRFPFVRSAGGQSSVELIAVLPLAFAVVLGVAQVLAAGAARELAGNAATAGAAAILQGHDPAAEARAAVPGWSRDRLVVRRSGRRVEVVLRPVAFVPPLAARLTARVVADAGPDSARMLR